MRRVAYLLVALWLLPAVASAGLVTWRYTGVITRNDTGFQGVAVGGPAAYTITIDTDAVNVGWAGLPASCGEYFALDVQFTFGGLTVSSPGSYVEVNHSDDYRDPGLVSVPDLPAVCPSCA
jgi:hypothetical protein